MKQRDIKDRYGIGELDLLKEGKRPADYIVNKIKAFEYNDLTDCQEVIFSILDTKIRDLESKHYITLNETTNTIRELGEKAGNTNILWGYYRKATVGTELDKILKMVEDDFKRPSRIVVDSDGRLWGDNTHTLIHWIYKLGDNVKVGDIPVYVVDVRRTGLNSGIIIDINNTVNDSLEDIKKAIACGYRINYYNEMGWRPLNTSYTLGQLADSLFQEGATNDRIQSTK